MCVCVCVCACVVSPPGRFGGGGGIGLLPQTSGLPQVSQGDGCGGVDGGVGHVLHAAVQRVLDGDVTHRHTRRVQDRVVSRPASARWFGRLCAAGLGGYAAAAAGGGGAVLTLLVGPAVGPAVGGSEERLGVVGGLARNLPVPLAHFLTLTGQLRRGGLLLPARPQGPVPAQAYAVAHRPRPGPHRGGPAHGGLVPGRLGGRGGGAEADDGVPGVVGLFGLRLESGGLGQGLLVALRGVAVPGVAVLLLWSVALSGPALLGLS